MVRSFEREGLVAQQKFRDERVFLLGRIEKLAALGRVPLPAECEQRSAVTPRCCRVIVPAEQISQFFVAVQVWEPGSQAVAESLVVVWIESEHILEVTYRFIVSSDHPERMSEPFTGSHVGASFHQYPELANTVLERVGANGSFPGGDPFLVVVEGFLAGGGALGEHDVGVGTVGGNLERPFRQPDPLLSVLGPERLVGDFLSLTERRRGGGDSQNLFHLLSHHSLDRALVRYYRHRFQSGFREARASGMLPTPEWIFLGHDKNPGCEVGVS